MKLDEFFNLPEKDAKTYLKTKINDCNDISAVNNINSILKRLDLENTDNIKGVNVYHEGGYRYYEKHVHLYFIITIENVENYITLILRSTRPGILTITQTMLSSSNRTRGGDCPNVYVYKNDQVFDKRKEYNYNKEEISLLMFMDPTSDIFQQPEAHKGIILSKKINRLNKVIDILTERIPLLMPYMNKYQEIINEGLIFDMVPKSKNGYNCICRAFFLMYATNMLYTLLPNETKTEGQSNTDLLQSNEEGLRKLIILQTIHYIISFGDGWDEKAYKPNPKSIFRKWDGTPNAFKHIKPEKLDVLKNIINGWVASKSFRPFCRTDVETALSCIIV